jgi:hypothetical protein
VTPRAEYTSAPRSILNKAVPRVIAVALLVLLFSDAASTLLSAGTDTVLPPCCRRDGKHQCALQISSGQGSSTGMAASRCPSFAKQTTPAKMSHPAPPSLHSYITPLFSHPAAKAQTEARRRMSDSRCRQKRGPPVLA